MFKAVETTSGLPVIICSAEWDDRIEDLRELDRRDELVCPECRAPVRVRSGEIRRAHFAHKELSDCPLATEAPEILAARVVLYRWLEGKFTPLGGTVSIERKLENRAGSCLVDCWVEYKQKAFAYLLRGSRRRRNGDDAWVVLRQASEDKTCTGVNWIFLARLLAEEPSPSLFVRLSSLERDLKVHSEFDDGAALASKVPVGLSHTLHYFDAEDEQLITYRCLRQVHSPQGFHGIRRSHPLTAMQVRPDNGELAHPGETEEREKYRQWAKTISPVASPAYVGWWHRSSSPAISVGESPETCMFCGKKTADLWSRNPAKNQYKCRECYRNGTF